VTPVQKLKQLILQTAISLKDLPDTLVITPENVDALYDEHYDLHQDARQEIRPGQKATGLQTEYRSDLRGAHRNYECDEVAMQAEDGSWIGWTYWHGGGKHSEPMAIPWVEYAYALDCKEREEVVIVQTFTKAA
jgi:hypothetical protein